MKKFLSLYVILVFILNISGYAVQPGKNQIPRKTDLPDTAPVKTNKAIKSLENQALTWLRESSIGNKSNSYYKNPHIEFWYGQPNKWLSDHMYSRLKLMRYAVIESPENVSIIYMDKPEVYKFFKGLKEDLINMYTNFTYSSSCTYNQPLFMALYDRLKNSENWLKNYNKRSYIELFELHRKMELCKKFETDPDTIAGLLITENRSFGENKMTQYSIRIVRKNEIY